MSLSYSVKKGFFAGPPHSLLSAWHVFQQFGVGRVMLDHRGVEVLPPVGSTPAEVLAEVLNLLDGMLSLNTSPSIRDLHTSTVETAASISPSCRLAVGSYQQQL